MKLSKFSHVVSASNRLTVLHQSATMNQIFGDNRLGVLADFLSTTRTQQEVVNFAQKLYKPSKVAMLLRMLDQGLFLTRSGTNQIFDCIALEAKNRKRGYRLLRILLTDVCNLRCSYCKVMQNIVDVTKHATSPENLKCAIRIFFDGSDVSTPKIIHISGGEPLIAWNHIKQITSFAESYKRINERYFIAIGTNAVLMNDKRAAFLADHKIKAIVSMDGRRNIHDILRRSHAGSGSFQQVDAGIHLLNRHKVELGLSMVIGKHNVNRLAPEITYMMEKYNPVSLGVNYMKPPTRDQANFPYLIQPREYVDAVYDAFCAFRDSGLFFELLYRKIYPFVMKKFRYHDCGAARGTTINIDAKGNIGPCKSFLVLNALVGDISDASNCPIKLPVFDSLRKRSPVYIDECQKCFAIGICGNACAYEAWVQSDDMMNRDMRACEYARLFFQKFIDDLATIVKKAMGSNPFYEPTKEDRLKLLGKTVVNEDSLSSSLGHAVDD